MDHNRQQKIAVVNDLTGFGRCSIAAALPVISAMGVQCCPLPTAAFSNHTGFDRYYWTDFAPHMDAWSDEWAALGLRFDGIATGFLGSEAQIEIVERFLLRFGTPECVVLVDPVMGDNGRLYPTYTRSLALRMARLIPYADILTPNLTEAAFLTETEYDPHPDEAKLLSLCRTLSAMGPRRVVISGLDFGDALGNFLFEADGDHRLITAPKFGECRSGTGDVFAAVLIAGAVRGMSFQNSVDRAAQFISHAMARTQARGIPPTDGICFEEVLGELTDL